MKQSRTADPSRVKGLRKRLQALRVKFVKSSSRLCGRAGKRFGRRVATESRKVREFKSRMK